MSTALALLIGFAAALVVAAGGYCAHALTRDGAIAATLVGTAIFGFGGLRWAAVMVGFFVLSSVLSRLGVRRERAADSFVEKGSRRDAVQVLANGGVAAIVAVAHGIAPGSGIFFPAFLGSMAAATADTWSTEIGALSKDAPRSILTGKPMLSGSSGGVTVLGFAGALGGAVVIGLIGGVANASALDLIFIGAITGYCGSIVDSLLGASIQQVNRCPACLTLTEKTVHDCGTATVPVRGLRGLNNDAVNGLTTLFGALCGGALYLLAR